MDQPQVLGMIPRSTRGSTKERSEESNQGTRPLGTGGLSVQEGRTVCTDHADSSARCRGQSDQVPRTVRKIHQNHQRRTGKTDYPQGPGGPFAPDPDRPLLKLGPSANRLQQKPKAKLDRKRI
jgi:hypothetical protein